MYSSRRRAMAFAIFFAHREGHPLRHPLHDVVARQAWPRRAAAAARRPRLPLGLRTRAPDRRRLRQSHRRQQAHPLDLAHDAPRPAAPLDRRPRESAHLALLAHPRALEHLPHSSTACSREGIFASTTVRGAKPHASSVSGSPTCRARSKSAKGAACARAPSSRTLCSLVAKAASSSRKLPNRARTVFARSSCRIPHRSSPNL